MFFESAVLFVIEGMKIEPNKGLSTKITGWCVFLMVNLGLMKLIVIGRVLLDA